MQYIVLILGIILILEIKFSPRIHIYYDNGINLFIYWKTVSTYGEIYRNKYQLKIKI